MFLSRIAASFPTLLCGTFLVLRDIAMHDCAELMTAYLWLHRSMCLGWDRSQRYILLPPFQPQMALRLARMVVRDALEEEGCLPFTVFGRAFCRPWLKTMVHLCFSDIGRRLRLHHLGQTTRGHAKGTPNEWLLGAGFSNSALLQGSRYEGATVGPDTIQYRHEPDRSSRYM